MTRFDQMSPVEQHAYRNYNNDDEYAREHDRLTREHFAGAHAGYGHRGGTLPWRASDQQRASYWTGQNTPTPAPNSPSAIQNVNSISEELKKLLANRMASLAGSNYPAYQGRTTVPMSSLTQRKRQLEEGFRNKSAPYSDKIESILNRPAQGFSQEQINSLLSRLEHGSQGVNENIGLKRLKKQFGENYANREARFASKGQKDINRMLPMSQRAFEDIGEQARNLNQGYNENLANSLNNLSLDKKGRREGLVSILGELGNQKHAHSAMVNSANRGTFDREVQEPYRKINLLSDLIGRHGGRVDEDDESPSADSIHSSNRRILEQGKRAYEAITPTYPGQLVAGLNADIDASHSLAERLSPSYRDNFYDERKALRRDLIGRENIGTRAVNSLPEQIAPREESLDYETKQLIKKAHGRINADNVARGVYGSQAHIGEMERAAREIIASSHNNRSNLFQSGLGDNLKRFNINDRNDINRLESLSKFGSNEYNEILGKIKGLNESGTNKWANEQSKLNSDYNNYEDELDWQWPHMRTANRGGNGGGRSPHLNAVSTLGATGRINNTDTQGLNLNSLRNQAPIAHSESERAVMPIADPISNAREFQQAMNPVDPVLQFPVSWDAYRALGGNDRNRLMQLYPEQAERARVEGSVYWSNPNWRQQEAERIRRQNEEHAARINQDAMDRLRGTGAYAPTSTGRSWLDYQLERDPHREEAIQWRRRYPGIHVYNADWRRQHGVPEHLINHPFNTY